MKNALFTLLSVLCIQTIITSQSKSKEYKIIESDETHMVIEFDFSNQFAVEDFFKDGIKFTRIIDSSVSLESPGNPNLPSRNFEIGIPNNAVANITLLNVEHEFYKDKFIAALPDSFGQTIDQLKFNQSIYGQNEFYPNAESQIISTSFFRYIKYATLSVAPYQFNPIERSLVFNKKIKLRIDFIKDFDNSKSYTKVTDRISEEFVSLHLLNPEQSKDFIDKMMYQTENQISEYWYNSNKDYYKIFVDEKAVYKITFNQLINVGTQIGTNTLITKLELYNNGEIVPIDVHDSNSDGVFNENDYLIFIGYPPKASPNCRLNIYNLTNIYWLSYQSDSTGLYYNSTNGVGSIFTRSYDSNLEKVHFEKDSIYENLGWSNSPNVDHWFWGKATYQNNQVMSRFEYRFQGDPDQNPDKLDYKLTVNLHGMTNYSNCTTDHKAYISLTGQEIGNIEWDGQSNVTFSKAFNGVTDSIGIYFENLLQVDVRGDLCSSDEIRINWADFEFWKYNRVHGKSFDFTNYDFSGVNRYILWQWGGADMHIFIPQKNKKIYYPATTQYVTFWDTIATSNTEYFVFATDETKEVDSIKIDVSSDLRNNSNAARLYNNYPIQSFFQLLIS